MKLNSLSAAAELASSVPPGEKHAFIIIPQALIIKHCCFTYIQIEAWFTAPGRAGDHVTSAGGSDWLWVCNHAERDCGISRTVAVLLVLDQWCWSSRVCEETPLTSLNQTVRIKQVCLLLTCSHIVLKNNHHVLYINWMLHYKTVFIWSYFQIIAHWFLHCFSVVSWTLNCSKTSKSS